MLPLAQKIEKELSNLVRDLGYEIVKITFLNSRKRKTLQMMIERLDGQSVSIQDCEIVSKEVSVSLDVINPVKHHYSLEVSSPGIERPLIKPADFIKFCGKPVVVTTYVLQNERKVFKGILEFASNNDIRLRLHKSPPGEENEISLMYEEISDAYIDGLKL
ncbi:MAG: ribosome maturation factor RimP [Holosporales bacterium]|jgi:ribosome maturation factor RimP|nr:ribosome maturation factor RimP [Holosporales bacterium]